MESPGYPGRFIIAALGTPQGLDPRLVWWHNFSPAGGPIWAWIRLAQPTAKINLRMSWGPLGVSLDRPGDARGILVTLPTSVANPPVRAELGAPGWVDFGHGRVPPGLGIPIVNGFARLRVVLPGDHTLALFAERFRNALGVKGNWLETAKGFAAERQDLVEEAFGETRGDPLLASVSTLAVQPSDGDGDGDKESWSGERFRTLREARRLSQFDVAKALTAMTETDPVSDDQIALFETGGRPRIKHLAARLDVLYRADGRSVVESVQGDENKGSITFLFPPWWVGPVWVKMTGPSLSTPEEIVLRWAPWEKHLLVRPGTTVSTRTASGNQEPLQIQMRPGWTATGGMGAYPGALDINDGWHPIDHSHADRVLNDYLPVYLQLFGKTLSELRRLLDKMQLRREE